jgi:hypothetical protein
VGSAAGSADRARALGGTVVVEPFEVLDVGRLAVIEDPAGAVLALWEARRHAGASVVGEPDTMCWNELVTPRPDLAREFYGGLFGWMCGGHDATPRTTFAADGMSRAGMRAIGPAEGSAPPHWLLYFGVRDCDGQAALVQSLGGRVREQPTDLAGGGRYAVVDDPQGATFAVLSRRSADWAGSR